MRTAGFIRTMAGAPARFALVLALMVPACGAQARTDGQAAVAGVGERIRANDCEGVVKRLNAGLTAGYPEVALLAGNLFETGTCVKAGWNKAVHFYSLAYEGGIREGALRLAAGFAAGANGPDMAAALWWAKRAGLQADSCTAGLPDTVDADQFVGALREWPAQRLAACNYVIGMISFIHAESRYPMAGVTREIAGRVEVTYQPALIHFRTETPGATGPAWRGLGDVITRALHFAGARYRKPPDIDPAWKIGFVVLVDTDRSRWW